MSYTETTSLNWFQRIRNALIGTLFGILLVIGCIWLLIWNEGRAIGTYRALAEGAAVVISVKSDGVVSGNDGKLVHVSGPVVAEGMPADTEYGIGAKGAVGLVRDVEMYQWVEDGHGETKKKLGGGEETVTTYSYKKEWRTDIVDSSDFKQPDGHANPDSMPKGRTFRVRDGRVGAFQVDGETLSAIGDRSDLALTGDDIEKIAAQSGIGLPAKTSGKGVYFGSNASSPEVGDIRIGYQRIDLSEASIIGKQGGDRLTAFPTSNGRDVFLSESGDVDAAAMFKTAQSDNALLTWLVRAGGLVGMFIGFVLLFGVFSVLGDIVPFIGSIIGFGTGVLAFFLTLLLGPLAIAIGWIAYRPLVAVGIIAGGVVLAFLVLRLRRGKAPAAAVPA